MRCFIAIDLEVEIKKEIKVIQEKLRKKVLFTGKFTETENLHLTLKFLGEINEEKVEKVKKILNKIKFNDFEVSLGDIGIFSAKSPRIIWIKLSGAGLWDLQKKIDDSLKELFPVEERFMSHVTIARIKKLGDRKEFLDYLKSIKSKNLSFRVKEFSLKKSELFPEGPRYEDIGVYSCNNIDS